MKTGATGIVNCGAYRRSIEVGTAGEFECGVRGIDDLVRGRTSGNFPRAGAGVVGQLSVGDSVTLSPSWMRQLRLSSSISGGVETRHGEANEAPANERAGLG